jgi:AcrR family transcriptional regulator
VSADKLSRHERRSAETKKRILQAAKAVFAKRGYGQASTREIAEAADVAEASIFYHFESKRGLLEAVVDDVAVALLEPVSALPEEDWLSWATDVLRQRIEAVKRDGPLLSALSHEAGLDDELRQRYPAQFLSSVDVLKAKLDELVAAGKMRSVNTAVVARAFLGSYLIFLAPFSDPKLEDVPAQEIVATLVDIYLRGLGLSPGGQAGDVVEDGRGGVA